jgi:hypothetical protein
MNPFEMLIQDLGKSMEIPLRADSKQSCLITFPKESLSIQIDLDANADKIVVGSQLGRITPGIYREKIFIQAMKANGTQLIPRGILAFSEKNDTLVLFQLLLLAYLTGEKLHQFLKLFHEHALIWKESLASGFIPLLEGEETPKGSGTFGLRP